MYRVHFDYLDVILTSATDSTTMTYFTTLLQHVDPKGKKYNLKILSKIEEYSRII